MLRQHLIDSKSLKFIFLICIIQQSERSFLFPSKFVVRNPEIENLKACKTLFGSLVIDS